MNRISSLRRALLLALACAAGAGLPASFAHAQSGDYPNKAVTFILPYPPGGLGDAIVRRLSLRLSEMWKVPVTVDNKPGAAGLLGAGLVAKAPADGYTLMYTIPETLSITKAAKQNVGFDPVNDFQPIALTALSSVVLTVPANSPHKTLKDFLDYAKKNPGKINFGVQGTGSGFHLALEQLKAVAGVDITAVPYKGAAPTMADLLGGRLDAMMVSTSVTMPHVQAGKLRNIAVASKDRVPQFPNIPTISESGYPGYDFPVGLAVFVRNGTPKPIVDKLSNDIRRVMHEPAMTEWLGTVFTATSNMTPDEFKARIAKEVQTYGQLIEKAHIKFE
ncbi:Bug family tripartite tricarboxylate transporter substrate binding protein [Ramlibacter sp.]|uniref:Bug family tripartite tricarboxylate transporter substrate binding protein n=1 Tax=Ramlibacter sp. TaxID=1917967 RepID=UPI003D0B3AD7